MNKESSLDNNPMEGSQDSEETCEMFKDVPKCVSEEEWTKLENADELSYVYMKKRYDFMTALDHSTPRGMNRDSSLDNNPMEDSQDSEETCEMFKDVPKCVSEEEWTKLENADKLSYVYMKKRYDFMTALGLKAIGPNFMPPTNPTPNSPEHDSDEPQNPGSHGSRKGNTDAWISRLRERKEHIVYEEISDPEEDD
ncbi:protein SSX9-like [Myotis lucifugus]|uniref:protein SSX9-like n=1 Tax=Myotis lucifugus TaxID=59463 RepID=UPI0006D70A04|nr:protein SSX9-like [Myotis lucifugus]